MKGWCVANHVRPIATTSSVELSAILVTGSGLGVTAARKAVLVLCEARAIRCSQRGRQHLHLRRKLCAGVVGNKGCNRHSHDGVQHVPRDVEGRNLVGDELHCEHDAADHKNPGVAERVETGG